MPETFLNPNEIIKLLPLRDGMTVADFGSGSGYFALAIAKLIKPGGKVFALDIYKPSLESLKFRARMSGLDGILETKQVDLESQQGSELKSQSCDLVLIANILFQIKSKDTLIKEAKRILKNNGLLVLIAWEKEELPNQEALFPINKEEAFNLIDKYGFQIERELSLGSTHYGFIAKFKDNT